MYEVVLRGRVEERYLVKAKSAEDAELRWMDGTMLSQDTWDYEVDYVREDFSDEDFEIDWDEED